MSRTRELTQTDSIEAQSAKNFVLVGFIFYIIGALTQLGFIAAGLVLGSILRQPPFNVGFDLPFATLGVLPLIFGAAVFALTIGLTVWTWITMKNIGEGKYPDARTATLVSGIFGIFLAWLIGGIFLLIAYGKLGEAIRGKQLPQAAPQREGRICTNCGKPVVWDAKFCEHCGKKLV